MSCEVVAETPDGWSLMVNIRDLESRALFLFFESARVFQAASHFSDRSIGLMAAACSLSLAYAVPLFGFVAAYTMGRNIQAIRHTQRALFLAHLVVASPPLFTAIGVLCFLLHAPSADYVVWLFLWIPLAILCVRGSRCTVEPIRSPEGTVRVRMAHGISAFFILAVFLVGHMINHIVAIWSLSSDVEVMTALRRIYRAGWAVAHD
jgi:hypothetical protein